MYGDVEYISSVRQLLKNYEKQKSREISTDNHPSIYLTTPPEVSAGWKTANKFID